MNCFSSTLDSLSTFEFQIGIGLKNCVKYLNYFIAVSATFYKSFKY